MKISVSRSLALLLDDLPLLDTFDKTYILRRFRCEGVKFLSTVLPSFAKMVISAIEKGRLPYDHKELHSSIAWKGRFPVLFRPVLRRLFDKNGHLRPSAELDPLALYVLRQVCEYYYKLSLPFSPSLKIKHANEFKEHDRSLLRKSSSQECLSFAEALRKSFYNNHKWLCEELPHKILHKYPCRPGPGTFSHKSSFPDEWFTWKYSIHPNPKLKGISGHFRKGRITRSRVDALWDVYISEVLFVPKNSLGPRVIVREPRSSLALQMSYFDFLSDYLEAYTQKRVNFKDQTKNQKLAAASSISRDLVTLDLKAASDSVSHVLTDRIFSDFRYYKYVVRYARTTHAVVLGEEPSDENLIELAKLAGMGSGLTFATMSLLIWHSLSYYISNAYGLPYKDVGNDIYVYGDDIILPRKWYEDALKCLELVCLEVNLDKSFVNGPFRESCGGDYLYGNDVGPTRLKLSSANIELHQKAGSVSSISDVDPTKHTKRLDYVESVIVSTKDTSDAFIVQLEAHCRELVNAGLLKLADYYYQLIEEELNSPLPYSSNDQFGGLCKLTYAPLVGSCDHTGMYSLVDVHIAVPVESGHTLSVKQMYLDTLYSPSPLTYSFDKNTKVSFELARHWRHSKSSAPRRPEGQGVGLGFYSDPSDTTGTIEIPREIQLTRTMMSQADLLTKPHSVIRTSVWEEYAKAFAVFCAAYLRVS